MWFVLLLVSIISLNAETWFVATTGNDGTGDGSIGTPFLTVYKGVNSMAVGDTLYIRAGTYVESVWPPTWTPGTAANPKTVSNYNGEAVKIQQNTDLDYREIVRLNNQSYWVFSGLWLDNSLARTNLAGQNVIKLTGNDYPNGSSNNIFTNCTITGSMRGQGVLINGGSHNNTFTQCTFSNNTLLSIVGDSPPHAIYIQSPSNTIDHCSFFGGGNHDMDIQCYAGGDDGASFTVVKYCLFNSGFKPIGFVHGNYNTAYNCVMMNTSGQSITAGEATSPSVGHRISNISIYGSSSGPQIYRSTNVVVENILVGACVTRGWAFSAEDATVINCTFRNIIVDTGFAGEPSGLYYPSTATLSNIYTNINTGMINPPTDMNIGAISYGIGRGIPVATFTDDYAGKVRGASWDIGAYQYQSTYGPQRLGRWLPATP